MANQDKQLQAMARQIEAMNLRIQGVSYSEIKRRLKFSSEGAACNAVKAAMKRTTAEPANELRQLDLARTDDLYSRTVEILNRKHYIVQAGRVVLDGRKRLENPEPIIKAVGVLTRILERRAALMGLDAPKVVGIADAGKPDWKKFITAALPDEDSLPLQEENAGDPGDSDD